MCVVCVHMCMYAYLCVYVVACMWRSDDSFQELEPIISIQRLTSGYEAWQHALFPAESFCQPSCFHAKCSQEGQTIASYSAQSLKNKPNAQNKLSHKAISLPPFCFLFLSISVKTLVISLCDRLTQPMNLLKGQLY